MTKTSKSRLVRLGDAKKLTQGEEGPGFENGLIRKDVG
jgi:hypothetical protein